ncbi:hypothetical protein EB796_003652 [Bugula neritina]|uniref:Uncharacterized protein n=1 Tax=Bugula neritina TaxID=10212 RepID=A0A7J7KH98_BUGNE|nr:hypothetical protein EB796_014049 [Bugula neritina]KAF6038050.1 hypothetical protein EB796_003652 [Bugula neritina]
MNASNSSSEEGEHPQFTDKPKKRKVLGSQKSIAKKRRVSQHVTGLDCKCSRLKCFEITSAEERLELIRGKLIIIMSI